MTLLALLECKRLSTTNCRRIEAQKKSTSRRESGNVTKACKSVSSLVRALRRLLEFPYTEQIPQGPTQT